MLVGIHFEDVANALLVLLADFLTDMADVGLVMFNYVNEKSVDQRKKICLFLVAK